MRNAYVSDYYNSDSSQPWFAYQPSREETLDCLPLYPDNYEKASQINSTEESFFPIYECAPRKAIPVGSNYQADIPEFNEEALIKDDLDKWIRDGFLANSDLDPVWDGEECDCVNMGSIRCIRLHIIEVRENMKKNLGMEKFIQLGFGDMGEEVALTWDPQDEKLFAEVVRSNPASFTKNFWDILPLAFPDKCKRELVSYYFNVYILRKRASQNRSDPLYINSDDDEWEAIEERVESEDELEMDNEEEQEDSGEEEDGSGLESSVDQPSNVTCQGDNVGLSSDVIEEADETGDGKDHVLPERTDSSRGLRLGIQDDSCMSFEVQHDQLARDIGKKDELLSTFDVIEEVFGKESCASD
jgi:ELM2 domain